jgi:hypothetical protein
VDHGAACERVPRTAAFSDVPVWRICRNRAPSGSDRNLRRAGLYHRTAHTGDRRARGAGCDRARCNWVGFAPISGDGFGGPGRRDPGGRRGRTFITASCRRYAAGSRRDFRADDSATIGGRSNRRLCSRPAGKPGGSGEGTASGVVLCRPRATATARRPNALRSHRGTPGVFQAAPI